MNNNPIAEIKKIEEEGQNLIEQAKKEADFMIADTHRRGQQTLDRAENEAQPKIEAILAEAKNKIAVLIDQGKKDLKGQIQALEKIDEQKIKQVADLVIKELV